MSKPKFFELNGAVINRDGIQYVNYNDSEYIIIIYLRYGLKTDLKHATFEDYKE